MINQFGHVNWTCTTLLSYCKLKHWSLNSQLKKFRVQKQNFNSGIKTLTHKTVESTFDEKKNEIKDKIKLFSNSPSICT